MMPTIGRGSPTAWPIIRIPMWQSRLTRNGGRTRQTIKKRGLISVLPICSNEHPYRKSRVVWFGSLKERDSLPSPRDPRFWHEGGRPGLFNAGAGAVQAHAGGRD